MNEDIKYLITDLADVWSGIISPIKRVLDTIGVTTHTIKLKEVLDEVHEIMPYVDCTDVPDYALTLLDSLDLPSNPKYGLELSTAAVYYLEAFFFFYGKQDKESAIMCLGVVDDIPEWRVIYGKQTLLEIKEEAKKLRQQINTTC